MFAGYTDPYGKGMLEMWIMRINNEMINLSLANHSRSLGSVVSYSIPALILIVSSKRSKNSKK